MAAGSSSSLVIYAGNGSNCINNNSNNLLNVQARINQCNSSWKSASENVQNTWKYGGKLHVTPISQRRRICHVMPISASCSLPPSDHNHNAAGQEYVECTIFEAVEVKSGSEGFMIKLRDGSHVRCSHNTSEGSGRLPDYAPQPAIVLRLEDGSNILLPIIVLEMPATMLMETLRNVHVTRPTIYQVIKDLVDIMGYKAKLVRVTKRIHEAYYAQLFLSKDGEGFQEVALDLRPSDAINIAARCKIPIQVNKQLAYSDGVRVINEVIKPEPMMRSQNYSIRTSFLTDLDRPQTTASKESEEFVLVWNMLMAAAEERYLDAARIRDELKELRSQEHI